MSFEDSRMVTADVTAPPILVVDDNRTNAMLLEQLLLAEGYRVHIASDGVEALDLIADRHPDLIFLDLDMPRVDGYEVCRRVKNDPATRLTPIVIITAQSAFEAKLRAWELGADDFITKPYQRLEVIARCRSLLRIKRLVDERDSAEAVVFAFARVVEAKSPYTYGHSDRVANYALALAARIELPESEWETLRKGALLHDVGKVSTPDAILDKPDSLTPGEFEIMKQHTIQGARIVESLRSVRDAVPLIRWHHERLDGAGYPDGLYGGAIPLMVRILSVADVYDALGSARPYRPAIPREQCLAILQQDAAGGGLDPDLVEQFTATLDSDLSPILKSVIHNGLDDVPGRPAVPGVPVNGKQAGSHPESLSEVTSPDRVAALKDVFRYGAH